MIDLLSPQRRQVFSVFLQPWQNREGGSPGASMNAPIDCLRLHFGHCFSRRFTNPVSRNSQDESRNPRTIWQAAEAMLPQVEPTLDSRSDSVSAQKWLWPKHAQDRRLAEAAFDAGCHVFLTAEKDILKRCHESLFAHGMAVLSPTQLIDALARSGELESDFGRHSPAPDLSTLSVLYAGFPEA